MDTDDYMDPKEIKDHAYKEYKLSKIEEQNLKELETELEKGKINSNNKNDLLDYLNKLLVKIKGIKNKEYEYEGDANYNINQALKRIKGLISKIESI